MPTRLSSAAAVLFALAACSPDGAVGPTADLPITAAAKPPSGGTDSRALWVLHGTLSDGTTATLLRGDGLAADGLTPADPSEYEGGRCSARATISWYAGSRPTGNAFFAPAGGAMDPLCPDGRDLTVVIGGVPQSVRWTTTASAIMQLALNESDTQDLMFGPTNTLPCARVLFSAEVGSGVTVSRTAGDDHGTPGAWTVESTGNHMAGCYVFAKGNKLSWNGTAYYLPFRAEIVELR